MHLSYNLGKAHLMKEEEKQYDLGQKDFLSQKLLNSVH